MKNELTLLIISFSFFHVCKSQNLEAHYKVVYNGTMQIGNGYTKTYTLDYEGRVYHHDSCTITFLKPLYLLNYPDGEIRITTPSGIALQVVRMDSIQFATLYKRDTVNTWNIEGVGNAIPRKVLHYKIRKGIPSYKFFDDARTINGLLCKHVFLYYPNSDKPWADIWYYPEYKLPYSFFGIGNLPGLLVKGDFYTLNYTFELISLKTNEPINESVFMPEYFTQPAIKTSRDADRKDSIRRKKIEIMSQ